MTKEEMDKLKLGDEVWVPYDDNGSAKIDRDVIMEIGYKENGDILWARGKFDKICLWDYRPSERLAAFEGMMNNFKLCLYYKKEFQKHEKLYKEFSRIYETFCQGEKNDNS